MPLCGRLRAAGAPQATPLSHLHFLVLSAAHRFFSFFPQPTAFPRRTHGGGVKRDLVRYTAYVHGAAGGTRVRANTSMPVLVHGPGSGSAALAAESLLTPGSADAMREKSMFAAYIAASVGHS